MVLEMKASPSPIRAILTTVLLLALGGCGAPSAPSSGGPTVPEEEITHAISHILIRPDRSQPLQPLAEALAILAEIRGGRAFADVARDRSQDEATAGRGGFIGFYVGTEDDPLSDAIQAVPIGAISSPIEATDGVHLVLRHTFDEARAREAARTVAAYGLFVPWSESVRPAPRSREEARALAARLTGEIRTGRKDLATAYREVHGRPPDRADVLIGRVQDVEEERAFYEKVRSVPEGAWIEPSEFPGGFTVVQRGKLLRTLVRQILIQHVESANRPLSVQRTRAEAKRIADEVMAQAKEDGSNWSELVTRYSDDVLSRPLQGFIGSISNGDLVPPLEAALLETPPGRVHPRVVETARGFHILYPVK